MDNYIPIRIMCDARQNECKVQIEKQEDLINKIKCDLLEVKQILTSIIDKNSNKGT